VREAWIGDQVNFHTGKEKREGRARKRLARAGNIVLPITIAAAALHLFMLRLPAGAAEESIHWAHQGLAFIALLFPAIAASLAGMEAHREHLRLEKRSANMAPQLEQLNKQMASATDPERFESLLQQVDEIMLRVKNALHYAHESLNTTHLYIQADLKAKEQALGTLQPTGGGFPRFKPDDALLAFLSAL
jgi:hypothetical protein